MAQRPGSVRVFASGFRHSVRDYFTQRPDGRSSGVFTSHSDDILECAGPCVLPLAQQYLGDAFGHWGRRNSRVSVRLGGVPGIRLIHRSHSTGREGWVGMFARTRRRVDGSPVFPVFRESAQL